MVYFSSGVSVHLHRPCAARIRLLMPAAAAALLPPRLNARVEAREAVEQVVLEAERRGPSALELGPEVSDRDPVAVCGEVDGGAVLAYEAAE